MRLALFLALAAAACGNPDNLVIGGISSNNGSPPVILNEPKSAIHNKVTLTNPQNGAAMGTATAIVLSDVPDLCTVLDQNPNFFRAPNIDFVALVMLAPLDRVGTFQSAAEAKTGMSEALASHAGPATQAVFPLLTGYLAITDLDYFGEATGSFDLIFIDGGGNGAELTGQYKTRACDALTRAALP